MTPQEAAKITNQQHVVVLLNSLLLNCEPAPQQQQPEAKPPVPQQPAQPAAGGGGHCWTVRLQRTAGAKFGLSLHQDSAGRMLINQLHPAGVAFQSGKVHENDQVVSTSITLSDSSNCVFTCTV